MGRLHNSFKNTLFGEKVSKEIKKKTLFNKSQIKDLKKIKGTITRNRITKIVVVEDSTDRKNNRRKKIELARTTQDNG